MQGQQLKFVDSELMDISAMLRETPALWNRYRERASQVTAIVNQCGVMKDSNNVAWRTYCIDTIQRYATYDHETRMDHGLSTWCESEWHKVLCDDTENVRALTGLGRYWLFTAQPALAKVYRIENLIEGASSIDSATNRQVVDRVRAANPDHREEVIQQCLVYRPQYTDARAYLKAATDFYSRAVSASDALHVVNGDLLIEAAQCHMHLAVTSMKKDALAVFTNAIRLVKRASDIPDFSVPYVLSEYLDEYGRYA